MLTGNDLRQKYLKFFESRGHQIIPSAPIVLSGDPTTLFTGSGMQPLVPYLLGAPHPAGVRLVNSQKCIRTQDIEEVGDNRHTTFFEMLGNWSLGDYFKEEQLTWIWEFFTKEVGLPKEKLHVTLFEGNDQVSRDEDSARIWQKLGVPDEHIHYYDARKNWWSRSGTPDQMPPGEPGGPDSEVFYDFGTPHDPKYGKECHPNCDCGRFIEIGNSVFMQYQKQADGTLKELEQKNVDFGGGLERILAAANNNPDVFKTDFFLEAAKVLEGVRLVGDEKNIRIILDHLRASLFLIAEGVTPSNKGQGYILRRLIRRAAVHSKIANIDLNVNLISVSQKLIQAYDGVYISLSKNQKIIHDTIQEELKKFEKTLEKGMRQVGKASSFDLYQTYGFPPEITEELMKNKGLEFDWKEFNEKLKAHQSSSKTSSAGMFKGGLADHSETVTKYHTATHLLQQALRDVLGEHVHQAGSNLTSERLRFDFTHDKALSTDQINEVEKIINEKTAADLPVEKKEMAYGEAIKAGALAFFKEKYPDRVTVYQIGDYSRELCGGPHVKATGEIGKIKIVKQESLGSSLRRVYLKLLS
ncbi:MAG: alanine--tRNA ligase [Microgenomates group bacterium]